jgi:pyrimidine-nucleoside phosphorylase
MTQWLRSVCRDGMSLDETFALTMAMVRSGVVIDWTGIAGPIADKHSTGGVGDALTLIAVPLAAACGAKVAKLSGRALGHTGGTIDKLECIPGLRTDLTIHEFQEQVVRIGCAVAGANVELAPADKKLYALRHRTATIASIPLIAASIMSKKLAAGAHVLILDVKYGGGAFMESAENARELAATMRAVGERAGRRVITLITSMDSPLADSAGDALELDEALFVLEGRGGSPDLRSLALTVAGLIVEAIGGSPRAVDVALHEGSALAKFSQMATAQGGRLSEFDRNFPPGASVIAASDGVVESIDARLIGEPVARAKSIALADVARRVGVRLLRRVGEQVRRGQTLLTCWLPEPDARLDRAVVVGTSAPVRRPLVLEISQDVAGHKSA